jgi:hypothetical protein
VRARHRDELGQRGLAHRHAAQLELGHRPGTLPTATVGCAPLTVTVVACAPLTVTVVACAPLTVTVVACAPVTVTAVANLAVKVADIDAAAAWFRRAGASVSDPEPWEGARRADVVLGALRLTLFTRALYEDALALPDEGFLHAAMFTDDLDGDTRGLQVVWGPRVITGAFGTRRVAFVEAPGGIRLEYMEQL